jgi:hypothetical protein
VSRSKKSIWNQIKQTRRVWGRKRPGESGTEKDQESLEGRRPGESGTGRGKTSRIWNQKRADQESLQTEKTRRKGRLGESGTGRGKTSSVWNRKREGQESLEPEEGRPGEFGTEREETGKV